MNLLRKSAILATVAGATLWGGLHAVGTPSPTGGTLGQWSAARPVVEKTIERRSRTDFGRLTENHFTQWTSKSTDDLLDEAADILSVSDATGTRRAIRATQARIVGLRQEIADLQFRSVSVPESNPTLAEGVLSRLSGGRLSPSKETFRAEIAGKEEEIRAAEVELKKQFQDFGLGLASLGIVIPEDQIEGLLTLATGDDVASMLAAFAAIKGITANLQQETISQSESIEVARRYYGIYVVLVEVALKTQANVIHRIDTVYLPELDKIAADTRRVQGETQRLLVSTGKDRRPVLKGNLDSQELTLKAAALYRQHLWGQRTAISETQRKLAGIHEVALNTYRTVRISSDLVLLMRTTSQEFGAVLAIELPPLRPFESLAMKDEFQKISAQIRSAR